MMTKEASTTCLRSSSLSTQVVTLERVITGLLRQLPLPSILNGGLQSALHPPNTSPFPVSSLMSHCMAPPIRTWHQRKNSLTTETGLYPHLRDKNVRRCHWISHIRFPKTRFRLGSSRPSRTEKQTHLAECVPDCPHAISSILAPRHWMTTTCLLSHGKYLAPGWSPIQSTVLIVMSHLVPRPRPLTADDVHPYPRATALPTLRFLISWTQPWPL
jgi:hypothetical protein